MTTLSNSEKLVKQEVLREMVITMSTSLYRYFDQNEIDEKNMRNPLVLLQDELRQVPDKIILANDEELIKIEGYVNYLHQLLKKLEIVRM